MQITIKDSKIFVENDMICEVDCASILNYTNVCKVIEACTKLDPDTKHSKIIDTLTSFKCLHFGIFYGEICGQALRVTEDLCVYRGDFSEIIKLDTKQNISKQIDGLMIYLNIEERFWG